MRLIGSFQTIAIQGTSRRSTVSGRSTSAGAGAVNGRLPSPAGPAPGPSVPLVGLDRSTALLTDHYELTMLQGALRSGTPHRRSVFEAFARQPPRRRPCVAVGGTSRG